MEIKRATAGKKYELPCSVANGEDGYSFLTAPAHGVILKMKPGEGFGGAIFISIDQLEEAGYTDMVSPFHRRRAMCNLFDRSEMVEIASRLGLKTIGTKQDLAMRISRKL